ncbi:hypothetical protein ACJ2A9_00730 [Anaerobacillus sp. MEB173]|uniref:hypothetical protein n=1 Tax=Anaerobacillus sp. MEB173 TaxID=3383345 RepID=UPI003F92ABCC
MKRSIIALLLLISAVLITAGCFGGEKGTLTRVDVEQMETDGSYSEVKMITESSIVENLQTVFSQIEWEPNTVAEMARKEDVLATLFFQFDKNMPERLYEYRIWFEEEGAATVISNNEAEGYGTLEHEYALILKVILMN